MESMNRYRIPKPISESSYTDFGGNIRKNPNFEKDLDIKSKLNLITEKENLSLKSELKRKDNEINKFLEKIGFLEKENAELKDNNQTTINLIENKSKETELQLREEIKKQKECLLNLNINLNEIQAKKDSIEKRYKEHLIIYHLGNQQDLTQETLSFLERLFQQREIILKEREEEISLNNEKISSKEEISRESEILDWEEIDFSSDSPQIKSEVCPFCSKSKQYRAKGCPECKTLANRYRNRNGTGMLEAWKKVAEKYEKTLINLEDFEDKTD